MQALYSTINPKSSRHQRRQVLVSGLVIHESLIKHLTVNKADQNLVCQLMAIYRGGQRPCPLLGGAAAASGDASVHET